MADRGSLNMWGAAHPCVSREGIHKSKMISAAQLTGIFCERGIKMRKPDVSDGFLLCWLMNMFLNWEWGFLALLLWAGHAWFELSPYPAVAVFSLWCIGAFALTSLISWSSNTVHHPDKRRKNLNPYSATTEKILFGEKKRDNQTEEEKYPPEKDKG